MCWHFAFEYIIIVYKMHFIEYTLNRNRQYMCGI